MWTAGRSKGGRGKVSVVVGVRWCNEKKKSAPTRYIQVRRSDKKEELSSRLLDDSGDSDDNDDDN